MASVEASAYRLGAALRRELIERTSHDADDPVPARLLGIGQYEVQQALSYFARRTRRSAFNTSCSMAPDLDGFAEDLDRENDARGVRGAVLVDREVFHTAPARILSPPSTLLAPVVLPSILADGHTLIFGGAQTPAGRSTAWVTRDRRLVELAQRVLDSLLEAAHPAAHSDYPGPRAVRTIRLIGRGHTDRQIATQLGVSLRTVAGDVARMLDLVGVDSRPALFARLSVRAN